MYVDQGALDGVSVIEETPPDAGCVLEVAPTPEMGRGLFPRPTPKARTVSGL